MPRSRPSHSNRGQINQLRIIGGKWRGRKLSFPDVSGLRPSGDRVRETLFNWLNFSLPGAYCLDLFAGSGALGLEALSRGAGRADLVEKNRAAATSLRQHCQTLGAEARVVEADALNWLADQVCEQRYDVVFLDPPFSEPLLAPACQQLEQQQLLADGALIYVESAASDAPAVPANWLLSKEKIAGQVAYRLYQRDIIKI